MTRQEFIDALSVRLSEGKSTSEVLGLVQYYQGYIDGEISRGRTEEEVLDDLGDPLLIARTILDSPLSSADLFGLNQEDPVEAYEEGAYEGSHTKTHEELKEEIERARQRTAEQYAASRADSGSAPVREPEEPFRYQGGHTETSAPSEKNPEEVSGGFMRDATGAFNWGAFALILAGVMLFIAVIWLITKVVSIFGPVILIVLAAILIIRTFLIGRNS